MPFKPVEIKGYVAEACAADFLKPPKCTVALALSHEPHGLWPMLLDLETDGDPIKEAKPRVEGAVLLFDTSPGELERRLGAMEALVDQTNRAFQDVHGEALAAEEEVLAQLKNRFGGSAKGFDWRP